MLTASLDDTGTGASREAQSAHGQLGHSRDALVISHSANNHSRLALLGAHEAGHLFLTQMGNGYRKRMRAFRYTARFLMHLRLIKNSNGINDNYFPMARKSPKRVRYKIRNASTEHASKQHKQQSMIHSQKNYPSYPSIIYRMYATHLGDRQRGAVHTAHEQALQDGLVEGRVRAASKEPVKLEIHCERHNVSIKTKRGCMA